MKIYEKLAKIQEQMLVFKEDGKNPHFSSTYLTLEGLNKIILPICNEMKLLILHRSEFDRFITEVINMEDLNEKITSAFPICETNPQKIGSIFTYAKRYNLGAIFNITTEEDDNGNFSSIPWYEKPKTEKKSETDQLLEEMESSENLTELKTLFAKLYLLGKSEKQKAFFKDKYEKKKKQLEK